MIEYLQNIGPWDWLGLAAILLLFEVLGGAGYLLWSSIAAVIVALINFAFPELPAVWQFALFAVATFICTWICWKRQRSGNRETGLPGLNQRGSEMIGQQYPLSEPIAAGRGKIRAGDTLWIVTGEDLPAGTLVRVLSQNGVTFAVEKA